MNPAAFSKGADQPQFFKLRVQGDTLVVSFRGPRPVASWAVVNGGMGTQVSHIINHHVHPQTQFENPAKTLRKAAGRLGIKGTFVGMMTGADIRKFSSASAVHNGLQVCVVSTAGCVNLATVGETGAYIERRAEKIPTGTINIIAAVNYGFTQEAMLEAMAIITEAKVRALYEIGLKSAATGEPATGTGTDCIAFAAGHERRYVFCGKHTKWGELVGRAALESVRGALHLANARAARG